MVEEGERDGDHLEMKEDVERSGEEVAVDGSSVRWDAGLSFFDGELPVTIKSWGLAWRNRQRTRNGARLT